MLGDLDGDGDLDLVAASSEEGDEEEFVSVLLGDGNGSFGGETLFPLLSNEPQALALADLDDDGDLDLAVSNEDLNTVSIRLNFCDNSETCPGDTDGDGNVGINDFLFLLAAWGPCPGHPADIDNDGTVGITDFLALLANWGPCP